MKQSVMWTWNSCVNRPDVNDIEPCTSNGIEVARTLTIEDVYDSDSLIVSHTIVGETLICHFATSSDAREVERINLQSEYIFKSSYLNAAIIVGETSSHHVTNSLMR